MLTGEKIRALEKKGERFTVTTESGKTLSTAAVVAGIGIETEVDLAKSLGLKIDNGIVVDEYLRAAPDIFAAGDVANRITSYNVCYTKLLRWNQVEDNFRAATI